MRLVKYLEQQVTPSKIVCVGRNYVEHIKELNNEMPEEMVLFVKPNSAISETLLSTHQEPLHYEAELCFLVKAGRFEAVGVGLDLTKRQLQSRLKAKGLPWERAKSFDGAALFSEFVPFDGDLDSLSFRLIVDGELRQQGDVALMLNRPEAMLAEIASFMTLEDGDILMTGTPKGVGQIVKGEHFTLELYQGEKQLASRSWVAQ
ncbi:fumarylacetoacetate hydrolase family protein [Shewanella halotolerans]|uniref:fumarylacetoacetate hydrolase family protein n=1 Tax=Shewanella halotolerans TaxID=2864204 RepID=UPI001C660B35|nr:fumarylacetoacetate hydrolase family protein [Shewanella halotolerans]QYJ88570.1 fumarylacetoacetate hydrolase family protein [Shewanella halotolerans]